MTASGTAQIKNTAFFKTLNENAKYVFVLVNMLVSYVFYQLLRWFLFFVTNFNPLF